MLSKMTIAGFHNFSDGTLWDNLRLPEGIDKDTFINEVLRQASEFPLLYSDFDFMKYQIGEFSKKWYHNFERWHAAYTAQYEALYNVDVKTTFDDNAKDTDDDLKHFDMKRFGKSEGKNQGHDNRGKAAYDAVNYANVESTSESTFSSLSSSDSEYHSESNSHSWEHSQTSEEWKRGNYGTTMSQELLLAEYNAWLFNLYEHMAEIFVSEFCICIYE